ncbi:MAG: hypothetical protein ACP59X_01675 [Solidesulfovibrio sp. DCME]|uniref:hypothetical protein n=1 Tax=Solidesulfovibrio sp. DCME TaxID=3447380 RepID=UPI003D14BCB6
MAAKTDALPPLLPVIPEYVPWLDKARDGAAADAARADGAFAGREGAMTAGVAGATPENPRGGIADETA